MTLEKTKPHVLLVEDDPGDAGLIRDALRENRFERFDVSWVRTMAEAASFFSASTIHVVLLDLNLQDSEGQDTVMAGLDMAGEVPVVVLTGNDDLDLARRVMDMGAQDYLLKGALDADSLGRALRHALSRKRVEVDLVRQKAHFQSLFTNTNDAIIFFDVAERIVNVNERFSHMFGYTPDEARGREINSVVDPERQAQDYVSPRILRGEAVEMEAVRFTRTGRPVHVLIKGGPVRVNGRIVGGYAIYSDITSRRQAEERIRNQEARLRAITESAQDAIVMIDPRGNISFWNPGAEAAFGYSEPEVMGRNMHQLLAPARYHEAHHRSFGEFQATGQGNALGQILELTALHKDGREIDVELSLSAFHQEDGWHAVGIMRDIRERKQAAKKLQEYAHRMEESNLELDAALLQARQATQAKSEFLANMSHEIRTPMNGVIGMVGLLLDTELNETQRRYAQTAQSSGEALLSLINDILDFSKIESGKLDMDNVEFQLRALLDDFTTMMAFKAEEKGLEFICFADPDVPDGLRGDPGRLRQILTNLAGNAVKFTERGEVVVRVQKAEGGRRKAEGNAGILECRDAGIDTVVGGKREGGGERHEVGHAYAEAASHKPQTTTLLFTIRDTGIGIPADKVGSLFQSFSQVDASVTRRFGGTGLGLAISRQLAGLMGGEIGVDSQEGQGSTFWFSVRMDLLDQPCGGAVLRGRFARHPHPGGGRQRHQPGDHPDPADVLGHAAG
jgi:PAS domain S-box-containing protein